MVSLLLYFMFVKFFLAHEHSSSKKTNKWNKLRLAFLAKLVQLFICNELASKWQENEIYLSSEM